jgi:hypothetical protein
VFSPALFRPATFALCACRILRIVVSKIEPLSGARSIVIVVELSIAMFTFAPGRGAGLSSSDVALRYRTLQCRNVGIPIIGPGHEIAVYSKGNLYIAQTTAGLQKLTFKGMRSSS